ncbi:MAG TPA: helix-hairpin-helix domain-containing protein [Acidobacteriota bacterium]|nr:helix-hairpin-helix domain-containing protein [Acidobacteriota bacterium]
MIFGLVSTAALMFAAPASAPVVVEQPAVSSLSMARQHATAGDAAWQQEAPLRPVDVNRANEEQLQTVPGIGLATARRILDWREQHGPFERLEDLLNIRGIGVTTLEKLRPYVTVVTQADSGA